VNGDGRDDLVYSSSTTSGSGTWMVMLANSSGGYNAAINTAVTNTNYAGAIPIDYNADGLEDLLVPYSGGTWWVMLGNASGLSSPVNTGAPATTTGTGTNARAMDVDGDGLQDLVWADIVGYAGGDAIRYRLRVNGAAFSPTVSALVGPYPPDQTLTTGIFGLAGQRSPRRIQDFNGDGRGDFIYRSQSRVWDDEQQKYIVSLRVTAFCVGAWQIDATWLAGSQALFFGDFNGDGKTDVLYRDAVGSHRMQFSTGKFFTTHTLLSAPSVTVEAILDWDGDGYDDALARNPTTGLWSVMRSTGQGMAAAVATGLSAGTAAFTVMDMNGDGMTDLGNTVSGVWTHRNHSGIRADLLQTATDAYGNFTTFNYAPLTSANYTKYADASYPEQDYQGSMYVVNTLNASNGIGGTFTNSFWYYGARVNLQGRGLEGFYSKRTQDSRNSLYAYDYFNRLFPYTGTVFRSDLYQSNGTTLVSRVQNAWTAHSYGASPENRSLPYVNQSTAYRYEVGGTSNGLLLSTAVTVNAVDSATGTLFDSTRTTTEASGVNGFQPGALHVQRLYQSSFSTDFTHWCFGRPEVTQAINSHTMPGGTSITRTSNTTWDGANCRPTQSVVEPGNTLWQVTTDYGYDSFGNVNAVTVTPASGQGQAARSSSVYWGTTGQFPATVTNAKGHVTSLGWNPALGLRTSVTDPNTLQVVWTYDDFGRLLREQRPGGTATDYVIAACNAGNSYCGIGAADLRSSVQIIARDTGGGAIRTDSQYFDGFDRPRYNYQQLQSGSNSGTITSYDALGRVSSTSTPFISTDPIWYTTYSYDPVNRPTQIQRQTSESDVSNSTTQIAYEGLRSVTTDPLSHTSTQVYNTIGQVVQAIDAAGSDTDYEYDAFGNLLKTRDVYNNEITLTYNVRGMKMTSSDPDMGAWSYNYFPLGELKSQIDAKSQTATFTYDELSRPLTRVEPTATANWTWDTAANGIGQLALVSYATGAYAEAYTFDTLGRPAQTSITNEGITYQYDYAYQSTTGLLDTLTYPASIAGERFKVRYGYQYGFLTSVQSYIGNVAGTTYWQSQGTNARGQTILEQFGNGLQTSSGYDRIAGWLDDRVTGASGTIQNLAYRWNKVGSLTERKDLNQSLTEHFYYDNLDRLDYSTLNSSTNLDLAYDAIGNITSKSDVGTYAYHATRKHAVVSTTGTINNTYGYDANGNMTSRNGQTTTWTTFNHPSRITQSSTLWSDFRYTHDRRLRWQGITNNGNVEAWWYAGGLLEKRQVGPNYEYRHLIYGADGPVAVRLRNNGGSSTYYLTSDHLGSTNAVTNAAGTTLVNESFDAFGKRRGSNWTGIPSAADNTQINASTKHGFTFHEHLANSGLIHMQGRVFDPVIGRFMSADP
jgi:YD repeat-containing protein